MDPVIFAELYTDAGCECQVRADTLDHFWHDLLHHFHAKVWRKRYREERDHPEFVDLGGES